MANNHNWVSEWLQGVEELERQEFSQAMASAREHAMERKALLIEFADILERLQELEAALWKKWR